MAGKINHNKSEIDGYVFDSDTEALFYEQLKNNSNVVPNSIEVHPKYELQPPFIDASGAKRKAINYIADFRYCEYVDDRKLQYKEHLVDIKGWLGQDNAFPLHWKMLDYKLLEKGLCLEVLKYSKTTGFVPYSEYKKIMKTKRAELVAEKNSYKGTLERIRYLNGKISELGSILAPTPSQTAKLGKLKEELGELMAK